MIWLLVLREEKRSMPVTVQPLTAPLRMTIFRRTETEVLMPLSELAVPITAKPPRSMETLLAAI